MSTGNQNLDLLIKLLRMTTRDSRGEWPMENIMVTALKRANEQLEKFDTNWEDLLRSRVTVVADPFGSSSEPPPPQVNSDTTIPPRPVTPPRQPKPRTKQPQQTSSQRPAAQPKPFAQTNGAAPSNQTNRPNKFKALCHKCGCSLAAGAGLMDDKSPITGNWRVMCQPGMCNTSAKPKGAARKDPNNLMDIL